MNDPRKLPYAAWLEESIKLLSEQDVKSICLAAIVNGGEALTAYYAADMTAMTVMAANIQADAMLQMVTANARMILDAAEEQEEDDDV